MEERARDARRRRIVQGGSDRLAFITGQISFLPAAPPPSSPPPPPSTPTVQVTTKEAIPPPQMPRFDPPLDISLASSIPLVRQERQTRYEDNEITAEHKKSEMVPRPTSLNNKLNPETVDTPLVSNDKPQSSIPPLPRPGVHSSAVPLPIQFTSQQVIHAISATENIRAICAIIMALLVIFSHDRASVFFVAIRWLVPLPIYMILLTDVTIVLAHAMADPSRTVSDEGGVKVGGGEQEWADQLERALGLGWVLYKGISSLFMDCSLYAVLIVSAFSLI